MKNTKYESGAWTVNYDRWDAKIHTLLWYICSLAMCVLAIALPLDVYKGNGLHFIVDYALFAWYLHLLLELNPQQTINEYLKTSDKLGLLEEVK